MSTRLPREAKHFNSFHNAIGHALQGENKDFPYVIAQMTHQGDIEVALQEFFPNAYVSIKRAYSFQVFQLFVGGNMSPPDGYVVAYFNKQATMIGAYSCLL